MPSQPTPGPSAGPIGPPAGDAGRAEGQAEQRLSRLNGRVDAMRAVLVRLLQEVVVAERRLGQSGAAQLLEANERLMVSALRHQTDAEAATQARDQAARSSELDALTQLPNRLLLLDRFAGAIANARRHGTRLGLLFIDLDNFKQINDSLGHVVGDEALRHAAQCLASAVRAGDTVSRHGGDEFLVLLAEVSQASDAQLVGQKMLGLMAETHAIGDHPIRLSASIGISIFPEHGDDPLTLIQHADAAMYQAKRAGPGRCRFHGEGVGADAGTAWPAGGVALPTSFRLVDALASPASRDQQLREANERLVLATLGAQELRDAMLEAQQRQREFLNGIAEELSDPMAPIRLASAQLGMAPSQEVLLPRAQALIERQASHMSRLVAELLAMLGGRDGRLRFRREPVDLIGILQAAVALAQPVVQGRRQRLSVHWPAGPLVVQGHPAYLAQIVGNLLDNASKYTPDGGEIGVAVSQQAGSVEIRVSDSGLGMTDETLPRVFDAFVQDTHAIGFNGVGVGIGLTVVKELVEAHGGSVAASSAGLGRGSLLRVTLPLAGAAAAADPGPADA